VYPPRARHARFTVSFHRRSAALARSSGETSQTISVRPCTSSKSSLPKSGKSSAARGYPLAALVVAGAVGYGIGYLLHRDWQSQGRNGNWSHDHDHLTNQDLSARNEGEGNKTAARQYNEAQRRFVETGKVEEKAREAEKSLDTEKRQLDQAETEAKRHKVAEDPAVTRKY
jgi:hypothetical protein